MAEMDRVKLTFADEGAFHDVYIDLPADIVQHYPRLIDALREDPTISAILYIDFRRLLSAQLLPSTAEGAEGAEG